MLPLTKPRDGFYFWLWRFLFHVNIARTLLWAEDIGNKRNTYFLLFGIIEKDFQIGPSIKAMTLIIGPIKINIGYKG